MSAEESSAYWDALADEWRHAQGETRQSAPTAAEIERRVRRQTLRMGLTAASEAAVLLAALAFSWRTATARDAGAPEWLVSGGVVLVTLLAGIFSLSNRRGLWRARSESASDFLSLLERRAVARLRACRFALWLLSAETLAFALWLPFAAEPDPASILRGYLFLAAWSGGALLLTLAVRHRARRALDALREGVGSPGSE